MSTLTPRITARVDAKTQELLAKAAALSGISSLNSFVLNAAVEKAKKIVDEDLSLKLSQRDAMLLIQALDQPTKKLDRLKNAAQRYAEKSQA
jgi:uncharacterized protein (DUF1778 family)